MTMPVRTLPLAQNWDCHNCSDCCRTYEVRVSQEERDRILKQGWMADPALAGCEPIVRDSKTGQYRLNHNSEGACVFLEDNKLCRIHAKFGEAAKPMACRVYPFILVPAGEHWRVGIRFACPSAAGNKGRPVADHSAALGEYAALFEDFVGPAAANATPPLLQPGQAVDWPDLIRFMRAFIDLVQMTETPIELRLRRVAALADICRKSTFESVAGPRLSDFLKVMTAVVLEDVPADPSAIRKPSWVGRMLFLQQLAIYSRKDNGPNSGIASRSRWTRLRAAWRYARGKGRIPKLHGLIPDKTFAEADRPGLPLASETQELLTRYFSIKILSLQFCGPTNFQRHFWDGLDSLLLVFPTVIWLGRVFTTPERNQAEAIQLALRLVDDSFGFNSLLGVPRQTWANRTMALRGEITRLIAWTGRTQTSPA
jgi:lysine-N-methylase